MENSHSLNQTIIRKIKILHFDLKGMFYLLTYCLIKIEDWLKINIISSKYSYENLFSNLIEN